MKWCWLPAKNLFAVAALASDESNSSDAGVNPLLCAEICHFTPQPAGDKPSRLFVSNRSLFVLIFWGRLSSVRGFCEAASLWQALRCGCRNSICLRSSYRVPVSTGLHSGRCLFWFFDCCPQCRFTRLVLKIAVLSAPCPGGARPELPSRARLLGAEPRDRV